MVKISDLFILVKGMELYRSTIIPRLPKSCEEISKTQKNLGKNKEFMSELYSFSKATQFFVILYINQVLMLYL